MELAVTSVKEKESLLVVSATEVAVMVGAALAPTGRTVGGVYTADRLGTAAGIRVPQFGEQGALLAVKAQVRPALVKSLLTEALTLTAGPPMDCEANLLRIATEMGGATIVNVNLSEMDVTALDVAVMVGEALAPVGGAAGG